MTNPHSRQTASNPAALTFADIPPSLAEGPTSLETVLSLLQGEGDRLLADRGIAAYDPHILDRISANAELESDDCLDRMHCLLELLDATLATDPPTLAHATVIGTVRHLTRFLADHQRWHALADNAAYYRDHPDIAHQVAARQTP